MSAYYIEGDLIVRALVLRYVTWCARNIPTSCPLNPLLVVILLTHFTA